ncbi:hypothetical protein QWY99_10600 [Flavobacterium branchiarum]|uniref:Uncharacterized protein n=1 Tax=Flavobacterium branchiarum TaxID=1114870 RepID=A0ABV5FSB8_9FLAO|nr:hypothetical protein [Flavobacterium branchiarum]MDN3673503.1 hypothetical protein [Flavobacterium branchiarum]
MKTSISFFLLLINLIASCQNKPKVIMQNSEITEKNVVNKLASEVKHFNNEPMYQLLITSNWCSSEIFINDIPVYTNFHEALDSPTVDINNFIFKSGIQKVTIKLYPLGKYQNENIDKFIAETGVKIEVNEYDRITEKDKKNIEYKTMKEEVHQHEEPVFVGVGKTYFEDSFTFNATVPYKVKGFENAQDLRKLDKEVLQRRILMEYNKIKDIYQNKDFDNIARASYESLRNQFISEYQDRKYINEVWMMLMDVYKLPSFEMQPIENYRLMFFADGKLIALMQDSKDLRVRGNTSLWAKFERGNGVETLFCNSYFYIPNEETEFKIY